MKIKLIEIRDEAVGTKSFFWEPEKEVKWLPGQYYYFTLPSMKYPDPKGSTRHFTISSSPTEGNLLRLTTRMREESGFKKTLGELPLGSVIDGEGPDGTFIFEESSAPNVFVAGGIGITPFRSMMKYVVDKGLKTPTYLIYSNSVPEEIAFRKDIEEFGKNPSIKVAMTVTRPTESKEKWDGLTGRVDENMIKNLLSQWGLEIGKVTFWLCGPPTMVDAMEDVFGKLGISSGKVRSEKFTGY